MNSVILPTQRSVVDEVLYGAESIAADGSAAAQQCQRVAALLNCMPPEFVPFFFAQTMPALARFRPDRGDAQYWREVYRILDDLPEGLVIASGSYEDFRLLYVEEDLLAVPNYSQAENEAAVVHARSNLVPYFILSFLGPPYAEMRSPVAVRAHMHGLVTAMHLFFTQNPAVARRALDSTLFALGNREVWDRLRLCVLDTDQPCWIEPEVPEGVLLACTQADRDWRHEFYEKWMDERVRPTEFTRFERRHRVMRTDPMLLVTLLKRMPDAFAGVSFPAYFAMRIYPDEPVPHDVAKQAIVFSTKHVVEVWLEMQWAFSRALQRRMHALAREGWRVSHLEFAMVIYQSIRRI